MPRRLLIPILLVVVVVLLLAVLSSSKVSYHWASDRNQTGSSATFACSTTSGDLSTFSKFVIVAPRAAGRNGAMLEQVAEELRVALGQRGLVYTVFPSGGGWTTVGPKVFTCSSRDEAVRLDPDILIFVTCKEWEYAAVPFFKKYRAVIDIRGGAPSRFSDAVKASPTQTRFVSSLPHEPANKLLNYSFDIGVTSSGDMRGIFSAESLTSAVAEKAANHAADRIRDYVKEQFDQYVDGQGDQESKDAEPAVVPG